MSLNDPRFRALLTGRQPFEVFIATALASLLIASDTFDEVMQRIAPDQIDWTEVVGGRPLYFYNGMTRRQVAATVDDPETGERLAEAVGRALRARNTDFPEVLGNRTADDRRARGGSLEELMTAERPRVTAATRPSGDDGAEDSVNPPVERLRRAEGEPPPPGQADSAATDGPQNVLTAGDIRTIDPQAPLVPPAGEGEAPEAGDPLPGQGVARLPATESQPAIPGLPPAGAEMVAAAESSGLRTEAPADATSDIAREADGQAGGGDGDEPTFGGHPYSDLEGKSDEELLAMPNIGARTVAKIREYERGR